MAKLPSLNILKAFEAAARNLSFKGAAEELCLSPSAISHQIRVLEKQLGIELFQRLNRAIKLTPKGEAYFKEVSHAISVLEKATESLTTQDSHKHITISCIPFVTNHFLIPHLPEFKQAHPDFSIKLLSQIELVDLQAGAVDMAVRYQKQDREDLEYIDLTQVKLSPVCSPEYWENFNESAGVFDEHKFISLSVDTKTWQAWMSEFQPGISIPKFEIELDNYQAVKQAALQGLGLAMGYWPAVQDEISKGNLIAPFSDQVTDYDAMYLVYPVEDRNKETVKLVRTWMNQIFKQFDVS